MKLFFDTSAFAKRYVCETGSDTIEKLCFQASEIYISILTVTEMISTLSRIKRELKITKQQYDLIKTALYNDLEHITICNITTSIIDKSVLLIENNPLKALDSLQIACAIELKIDQFISGDLQQIRAAKKSNLEVKRI